MIYLYLIKLYVYINIIYVNYLLYLFGYPIQVYDQVLDQKVLLQHVLCHLLHGHVLGRHHEGGAEHDPDVGGRHLVDAAQVRHAPEVPQQAQQGVAVRGGQLPNHASH